MKIDENLPGGYRFEITRKTVLLALINCQLGEVAARRAMHQAYIQFMFWKKQRPKARLNQITEETRSKNTWQAMSDMYDEENDINQSLNMNQEFREKKKKPGLLKSL